MSLLAKLNKPTVPRKEKPQMPPAAPAPPPAAPEMQNVALVFLDDPLARKLAVAWTMTGGDEDLWEEAAGLSPADRQVSYRLCRALRINGICRDGGVTDPT